MLTLKPNWPPTSCPQAEDRPGHQGMKGTSWGLVCSLLCFFSLSFYFPISTPKVFEHTSTQRGPCRALPAPRNDLPTYSVRRQNSKCTSERGGGTGRDDRVEGGMEWEFGLSRCKLLMLRMDLQQGPTVEHRELDSISWDKPSWKRI